MTNIRKVAELADVSVATVSRTLKTPDIVSPETRDRVLAAVEKAGYRPNMMAVQFRSQRTRNLVVLVPTIANTFFARVIGGIQEAAQRRGYGILLCNTLGDERTERAYAGMVSTRQADGLIQLRAYDPFTTLNGQERPPMVNVCEVLDEAPCPTVKLDNRAAARAVTEHLLSLGHHRIGMIKGPRNSPLTRDRLLGFQDALAAAGLTPDKSLWCPGDFTPPSGHRAAGDLLARTDPPTAIFCENDEMAMGAMRRIKEAGLRVPEDISVAGFDDIAFASYCAPSLTTIAQPAEDFGHEAVSLLLDIIDDRDDAADQHRIMPFELVVRESTGLAV
ncbi:transcriptional regulator CytR [Halomonas eurihalina]|uniref:Transcriptional regulator CytR n=1 Tax=Halomonas eurihalina TaxID=42566 RepID=A0A5D9DDS5_HALER|nr:LacI family DNA-binding transcriptional regulator [Halomonas eurihalina]MDR5858059.1 LacI family DNA-binding transcriptional regulator [Halomonas eurihalina]TZG41432.1 transcriptional regulator CytR [Halomonas eurihalina]